MIIFTGKTALHQLDKKDVRNSLQSLTNRQLCQEYRQSVEHYLHISKLKANGRDCYLGDPMHRVSADATFHLHAVLFELFSRSYPVKKIANVPHERVASLIDEVEEYRRRSCDTQNE